MPTAQIDLFGIPTGAAARDGKHFALFGQLEIECPTQVPAGACARIKACLINGRWIASSADVITLDAGGIPGAHDRGAKPQPTADASPAPVRQHAAPSHDPTGMTAGAVSRADSSSALGSASPAPRTGPAPNAQTLAQQPRAGVASTPAAGSPFASLARRGPGAQPASSSHAGTGRTDGQNTYAAAPAAAAVRATADAASAKRQVRPPFDPDNMDVSEDIPF